MSPLSASQIHGNWATLLSAWNADDSLDINRVGDQIDTLIAMKVDGIYSHGTAERRVAQFPRICEAESGFIVRVQRLYPCFWLAFYPFHLLTY